MLFCVVRLLFRPAIWRDADFEGLAKRWLLARLQACNPRAMASPGKASLPLFHCNGISSGESLCWSFRPRSSAHRRLCRTRAHAEHVDVSDSFFTSAGPPDPVSLSIIRSTGEAVAASPGLAR